MRKLNLITIDSFITWTHTQDSKDEAILTLRYGRSNTKTTLMIYSDWFKGFAHCKTENLTYYRFGWFELNLPDQKEITRKTYHTTFLF